MDAATRTFVRQRASDRCEYCRLPQDYSAVTHHLEHIVPKQHGGIESDENLALACHRCNLKKGPNLAAIDPVSGDLVRLFNPRQDRWEEHFLIEGARIEGRTPFGRATVRLLAMNDVRRIELRSELLKHDSAKS